jgi:crossover junction endodeoxyribonuclease RuvC
MIFIGIDPGKAGSISIISGDALDVIPVPIVNDDYDMKEMYRLLMSYSLDSFAIIERAQAMPGQGTVSMFTFGKGYGLWLMALTVSKIPFQIIHPRVWTKVMLLGASGEGKERAISVAQHLFPRWNPQKKKELQYCDSILLAEYGRRLKRGG